MLGELYTLSNVILLTLFIIPNNNDMENIKEQVDKTNPNQKEGKVATKLEEQTAKIPSDVFLWAALGSMFISLILKITGSSKTALFIGQWAPSFLLFGIYNKLVKQLGHD